MFVLGFKLWRERRLRQSWQELARELWSTSPFGLPVTVEAVRAEEERQAADPNPPELPDSLKDAQTILDRMRLDPLSVSMTAGEAQHAAIFLDRARRLKE